jgi:alkylation response protein AidB-like acyl-CoA dehydrogenase
VAFLPTADQLELQRSVRDVLAARWPLDGLVAAADTGEAAGSAAARAAWQSLTETGVFDLHTELGLGWVDAALVFAELGRALAPGPLVATYLAGVHGHAGPTALADLTQSPVSVAHLDVATSLLVLDETQARIIPVDDALHADPIARPVDPLTALFAVGQPLGADTVDLLPDGVTVVRRQGALLTAALQVGIARHLLDAAVDYAKQREQFGSPIGGFQAVKHLCADMYARVELANVAMEAAAVALEDPEADATRAVAGAKLLADEAATANGRACIQVHGGIGFTWELPLHLFLKRAWLHATEWGAAGEMAELVAGQL